MKIGYTDSDKSRRDSMRFFLAVFVAAFACESHAELIVGSPHGGPGVVHGGAFDIDLNGDGIPDIGINDIADVP
jgi:hypothetical protein